MRIMPMHTSRRKHGVVDAVNPLVTIAAHAVHVVFPAL